MKPQEIRNELKALKERMADLQKQIPTMTTEDKVTVKVGEKGGLVIYGLGRFPVHLYASQAIRLQKLMNSDKFQEFVMANQDKLAKKAE